MAIPCYPIVDSRDLQLGPREGMEIKYLMPKGCAPGLFMDIELEKFRIREPFRRIPPS